MPDGRKSVECVPSSWVSYDSQAGSCVAFFMPPPYDEDSTSILEDLIENCLEAPKFWPLYECLLRGHAATYEEAMRRLNILLKDNYAYTTEDEVHAEETAKRETNKYKNATENTLKQILEVKKIPRSSSSPEGSEKEFDSEIAENSSSQEETETLKIRRKKNTKSSPRPSKKPKVKSPTVVSSYKKSVSKVSSLGSTSKKSSNLSISPSITISPFPWKNPFTQKKLPETQQTVNKQDKSSLEAKSSMAVPTPVSGKNKFSRAIPLNSQNVEPKTPTGSKIAEKNSEEFDLNAKKVSNDTKFLYRAINRLTHLVKTQTTEIHNLRNSLELSLKLKVNELMTMEKFVKKYQFTKLKTIAEFVEFDNLLKSNDEFKEDFKATLQSCLESKRRTTVITIVKTFFERELAMQCTAIRLPISTSEKYILKDTAFSENILAFIRTCFHGEQTALVPEQLYYRDLSACLTNSKDWDGNRSARRLRQVNTVTAE